MTILVQSNCHMAHGRLPELPEGGMIIVCGALY